jgi:hypothetical protein
MLSGAGVLLNKLWLGLLKIKPHGKFVKALEARL